jgi:predicted dehydrogenase
VQSARALKKFYQKNKNNNTMKKVRFGIIGLGLMGREFASAAARWPHLLDMDIQPEIISICGNPLTEETIAWYKSIAPSIKQCTDDYKKVLSNPEVDAIYCAVPHNLHEQFYCDIIKAGKHLLGEKPFGIDKKANENILKTIKENPDVFVRCSSEFPFAPAMQRLCGMIENNEFGKIIEVEAGFLHSSDLDPTKPMNWKRMIETNGKYGSMGDLGMHACHVPFRAGWIPQNVRAVLLNIITERPDGKGKIVPCETIDNAVLFCETKENKTGNIFPMTIKTFRISPGDKDTWYLNITGTKASAKFSTKNINLIQILQYTGKEQAWQQIDMGHETTFKSITGGIFEIGFSDLILQMWAAFLYELEHKKPIKHFAGCVKPEETAMSHKLFTAALESYKYKKVVEII